MLSELLRRLKLSVQWCHLLNTSCSYRKERNPTWRLQRGFDHSNYHSSLNATHRTKCKHRMKLESKQEQKDAVRRSCHFEDVYQVVGMPPFLSKCAKVKPFCSEAFPMWSKYQLVIVCAKLAFSSWFVLSASGYVNHIWCTSSHIESADRR